MLSFITLLWLVCSVSSKTYDLNDDIVVSFECDLEDPDDRTITFTILQTKNAVANTYIALGPGTDMTDMDPTICINDDGALDCKDYGSAAWEAPILDTSENPAGQNNHYIDDFDSDFDETEGTVKYVYT